ncbi:hypothetical protein V1264_019601 [Littorina saxatilis]|uniref:Integrase catalytic domain-containing protein n=1 Tax=Littorina saxatilis TaxID=31220 RepID=A0AAN9BGX7_9CAEN
METVFSDMNLVELIIFLDDILIHAQSLEELEERTVKVLERLRKFNLKLDPSKCIFGATEIRHLGYMISEGTIRPDPEKLAAVTSWPRPSTVKEVKSFLGFAGFYRRFIEDFASLAKPLNDLTIGYVPAKCKKKTGSKKPTLSLSSDISHLWGEKQQKAFQSIIQALTNSPVLGIADKRKPFTLHCDASGTGLGAVLYQEQDKQLKVIAYASRGLNKSEQNYPAHKREFLALKWAMSDKFSDYLLGSPVTVVTDNNPLCYILKNAKLDATSHRWLSSLSIFDFQLRYKKGTTHVDADALSRRPQEPPEEDLEYQKMMEETEFLRDKAKRFEEEAQATVELNRETVCAILTAKGVRRTATLCRQSVQHREQFQDDTEFQDSESEWYPAVEHLVKNPELISDDILGPPEEPTPRSERCWRKLQLEDKNLAIVIKHLEQRVKLDASKTEHCTPELKMLAKEQGKLEVKDGVLYRRVLEEDNIRWQLVVPSSHRAEAMRGVHEDLFHTHAEDAIRQARLRFFWPYMARDIETKIKKCSRCIRRGARQQKAPMNSIETSFPLELLSIDYLTIDVKGQKQNILVVMDHFTKFGTAICTKDQTAKTVAKALWNNFFMIYGFPKRILSDQGRDFESQLLKEVCDLAGIKKCRTTPYHPSGNPVERWNRTLIHMLRSLEDEQKVDWRKSLPAAVHAYNCCIHQSTSFSPYFLFFGRQPRLPIDLAFGIDLSKDKRTPRQYVRTLKEQLKKSYDLATANMTKSANRNKARYDSAAHAAELECGDRVLVRRLGPRIVSKVTDRWEKGVYIVVSKSPNVPVYTVQEETGSGPKRTLHRNLLLPIGMLGGDTMAVRPTPAPRRNIPKKNIPVIESDDEQEETDMEPFQVLIKLERDGLNVNAPAFVPSTRDDSEKAKSESEDSSSGEQADASSEETESEEEISETEEETSGNEEETSGSEEEISETEGETSARSPPRRRSTRIRRPVERLNLCHRVGLERLVNCRLSEVVTQSLVTLQDIPMSDGMARDIEDALRTIIHLCS